MRYSQYFTLFFMRLVSKRDSQTAINKVSSKKQLIDSDNAFFIAFLINFTTAVSCYLRRKFANETIRKHERANFQHFQNFHVINTYINAFHTYLAPRFLWWLVWEFSWKEAILMRTRHKHLFYLTKMFYKNVLRLHNAINGTGSL